MPSSFVIVGLRYLRYAVETVASEPEHELGPSDFGHSARIWRCLPREGLQLTPEQQRVDFKWKDYCPTVFRFHFMSFPYRRLLCSMHRCYS